MTTQINLDDPRVKRTRQLLQEAFKALMREKPFRDLTVQDITDRATVNRATFYAHYQDKYDLLDSSLRDFFRELLGSKLPAPTRWSADNLLVLIRTVLEFMTFFVHDCHPIDRELDPMLEMATQEEIQRVLLAWFAQPTFTGRIAGVAPTTMATAWSWAIFGAASAWSHGDRQVSADDMTRQVLLILVR